MIQGDYDRPVPLLRWDPYVLPAWSPSSRAQQYTWRQYLHLEDGGWFFLANGGLLTCNGGRLHRHCHDDTDDCDTGYGIPSLRSMFYSPCLWPFSHTTYKGVRPSFAAWLTAAPCSSSSSRKRPARGQTGTRRERVPTHRRPPD